MAFKRHIDNGGTVCTVGMFDGVHRGHQLILQRLREVAAERGLRPVVVTFDRHPRVVLGHTDNGFRLLTTVEERTRLFAHHGMDCGVETLTFTPDMARLSACEFYDRVLREALNTKVLLLGYDNMFGNKQKNDFGRLLAMPDVDIIRTEALVCDGVEISSTQIRKRLAVGDIVGANAMLGYRYAVEGRVVHGRAVGRTIDFPTANIELSDTMKAMPMEGVYAVTLTVNGHELDGMANWGGKPTLGEPEPTLEVNLIGFNGNLYGRSLTVHFVERLRDIIRFGSIEELSRQLERDRHETLRILHQ